MINVEEGKMCVVEEVIIDWKNVSNGQVEKCMTVRLGYLMWTVCEVFNGRS